MADEEGKSASGVHVDKEGNRVAGGSLRADGSVRRTVRVREGYTPAEDIKRYSAREAREQRLKEQEQEQEQDTPHRRPSRFGALNSMLKENARETPSTHSSKKETAAVARETKEELPRHQNVTLSTQEEDISADLSKLSLHPDDVTPREPSPSTVPQPSLRPKKKYTPPQRRKKYTLDDLDKQ